jgi:hypothetical protein
VQSWFQAAAPVALGVPRGGFLADFQPAGASRSRLRGSRSKNAETHIHKNLYIYIYIYTHVSAGIDFVDSFEKVGVYIHPHMGVQTHTGTEPRSSRRAQEARKLIRLTFLMFWSKSSTAWPTSDHLWEPACWYRVFVELRCWGYISSNLGGQSLWVGQVFHSNRSEQ